MTLDATLRPYRQAFNEALEHLVEIHTAGPDQLDLMLKYHLGWIAEDGTPLTKKLSGKQIRPLLLLLAADLAGAHWQDALPAAVAVELVHNFSLIHDDIEDNSDARRGRPTLWKLWGTAQAINTGDSMFALSYAALGSLAETNTPPEIIVNATRCFTRTNLELTQGQHLDMAFEEMPIVPTDNYITMIGGKSASLIACSMALGAIIAGASPSEQKLYHTFGFQLGLAFQIRDDILGLWGDEHLTGKSAISDIVTHKKSLPILYGLAQSSALQEMYSRNYVKGDETQILAILEDVNAQAYAHDYEKECVETAMTAANQIRVKSETAHTTMMALVDWLLNRSY